MNQHDRIAISAIVVFLFAISMLRYTGIPDQYATLFAGYNNPEHFLNDIYLNNAFYYKGSYFFAINKYLGLDTSEVHTICWYLVSTAVSFYFTYLIIDRHFGLNAPLQIFVIFLFISLVDRNFPVGGWGGILPTAPGLPAMFARVIALMALYLMLEKRIWLSAALITVVFSIHISGDFILFPILFFYILFNKDCANKNLAALLLPIAFLMFRFLTSSLEVPTGHDAGTYERVMYMAATDGDFLKQSPMALMLFAISFLGFAVFLRHFGNKDTTKERLSPNLIPLLKAVFVASLLVVVGAILYTSIGYRLYFYPPLIMLGPVRAMNFYSLFFFLSAFVVILQAIKLTSIEKSSLMLALVLIHSASFKGIAYPAVVLVGGIVLSRYFGGKFSWLSTGKSVATLSLILVIALTGARLSIGNVYYTSFDTLGWKHIQRWTKTIDADESVWIAYKKIRSIKADFNMLPFFRNREGKLIGGNAYLHILAEKSHFMEDEKFFYLNAKKWAEYKVRRKAYDDVSASIENSQLISNSTLDVLRSRKVAIVVPSVDANSLTGWTKKIVLDNYYILHYLD